MGLGNILRNIRDRGLTDVLDPEVHKAYAEWKEIEKNGIHLEAEEIQSFAEQVVYRMSRCPMCMEAGECVDGKKPCHCPMPEKAMTPLAKCSEGRWPKMMPSEDWKEFKKENGIQLIAIGG